MTERTVGADTGICIDMLIGRTEIGGEEEEATDDHNKEQKKRARFRNIKENNS